jgi:hypothetical protein
MKKWKGVFARGRRLWIRYKGYPTPKHPKGEWRNDPTEYVVGQEALAAKALAAVRRQIEAGVELAPEKTGPLAVGDFCERSFFPDRRQFLSDWKGDACATTFSKCSCRTAGPSKRWP